MEGIPQKDDKSFGKEALRVIRGVLDKTIPSEDIAKTGTVLATPETVKKVLEENTIVTPAMKEDARIADIEHEKKLGENY